MCKDILELELHSSAECQKEGNEQAENLASLHTVDKGKAVTFSTLEYKREVTTNKSSNIFSEGT
jgi:hypothetical protein